MLGLEVGGGHGEDGREDGSGGSEDIGNCDSDFDSARSAAERIANFLSDCSLWDEC